MNLSISEPLISCLKSYERLGSFPAFDLIKRLPIIMCIMTAIYHVNIFSFCCSVLHILKFSFRFATYLFSRFRNCFCQPEFLVVSNETQFGLFQPEKEILAVCLVGSWRIVRKVENLGCKEGMHMGPHHTVRTMTGLGHEDRQGIHSHSVNGTTACPPPSPLLVTWKHDVWCVCTLSCSVVSDSLQPHGL